MLIDDLEYTLLETIELKSGSGDSEESWHMSMLANPQGETVLFHQEKEKSHLYLPLEQGLAPEQIATTHETCTEDLVKSTRGFSHRDATLSWVSTHEPFEDAPLPFRGTRNAMIMSSASKSNSFLTVPLWKLGEDNFFSARRPAAELPGLEVETKKPSRVSAALEFSVALLLLSGFGYGIAVGSPLPLRLYWWSAPVVGLLYFLLTPANVFHAATRLWTGAFFLHFATHSLDIWLTENFLSEQSALGFETLRAGVMFAILLALRFVWLRGYCIFVDAGANGGGCAWVLFASALFIVSGLSDFSYFPWFRWYSGAFPWGILILLLFLKALHTSYQDYRLAPLTHSDFLGELQVAERILAAGMQAREHHQELTRCCDDIEDGLRMSLDPALIRLRGLGDSFLELKKAVENLAELENLTVSDAEIVKQDLSTARDDILAISTLSRSEEVQDSVPKIRVSPYLLTYQW